MGADAFASLQVMITDRSAFAFAVLAIVISVPDMNAEPQWMTLPPTPVLPQADRSGYAPVNGVKIWYAVFGRGEPVILLHGGLANSNYWGKCQRSVKTSQ